MSNLAILVLPALLNYLVGMTIDRLHTVCRAGTTAKLAERLVKTFRNERVTKVVSVEGFRLTIDDASVKASRPVAALLPTAVILVVVLDFSAAVAQPGLSYCRFTSGPFAGRLVDLRALGLQGVRSGMPCTDGKGSSGTVFSLPLSSPSPRPAPAPLPSAPFTPPTAGGVPTAPK